MTVFKSFLFFTFISIAEINPFFENKFCANSISEITNSLSTSDAKENILLTIALSELYGLTPKAVFVLKFG